MRKIFFAAVIAVSGFQALAAGFGLYEASARGNAMGGALVGSTRDASAVYYNPANMTETTNVSVMVGATLVWLYADIQVDSRHPSDMNPGLFCIPNIYMTTPVWGDLYFGLGLYCENGLGTQYEDRWDLAGDTTKTTLEQFSLNPNLAYKLTDWWSFALGIKMSYITFFNQKRPYWNSAYGTRGYDLVSELDGNDLSLGYNFGTTFTLFDNADAGRLKLGVVYRSEIPHEIEGDFDIYGSIPYGSRRISYVQAGGDLHSEASAELTLPLSATAGLNWDSPSDKWHVGAVATWTKWSSVDTIRFEIPAHKPGGGSSSEDLQLLWDNVWRFGGGVEYDILDDLSLRCGYVYDMDPSSGEHGTTMLPGGDRHMIGLGFGYYVWSTLRLDLSYNLVMMEPSEREISVYGQSTKRFGIDNAYSHMLGLSLSYAF